jgi:hypothetical protein
VLFDVTLGRLVGVVVGMQVMSVRHVGVVRGLLVRTAFMVLCCFLVMMGRVFEVFGGLPVMLCSLLRHRVLHSGYGDSLTCHSRVGRRSPLPTSVIVTTPINESIVRTLCRRIFTEAVVPAGASRDSECSVKSAKVAKVTIPSTLAILATLPIFLDESRALASRRRAEGPRDEKSGGYRQGRRQGG